MSKVTTERLGMVVVAWKLVPSSKPVTLMLGFATVVPLKLIKPGKKELLALRLYKQYAVGSHSADEKKNIPGMVTVFWKVTL